MWIAGAMDRMGEHQDKMWDEEDGFFYDVLRLPNGQAFRLKVRSMVGLLPLAAVAIFEEGTLEKLPTARKRIQEFMERHPDLAANLHMPGTPGVAGRRLLSTVNEEKLRRILARMLDENEFFGPHGIRALSRYHLDHPFVFDLGGQEYRVSYLPGDSDSGMFGGNSNWRGPVWMPVNFLLYLSLLRLGAYYGDSFKVECPTGSGNQMTLFEVAQRAGRASHQNICPGRLGAQTGVWRHGEIPDRPALARQHPLLRVLPWRQRRRYRRQPPNWMDGLHCADHSGKRRLHRRNAQRAEYRAPCDQNGTRPESFRQVIR